MHAPPPRAPRAPARLHLRAGVALALLATSAGCLSHEHRIPQAELARLARLAPEARGARVRVVQEIGGRRGRSIEPGAGAPSGHLAQPDHPDAPQPSGPWPAEPGWAPPPAPADGASGPGGLDVALGVHVDVHGGGAPGPRPTPRPRGGSAGRTTAWRGGEPRVAGPAPVAPGSNASPGRGRGSWRTGGGGGGGGGFSLPSGGGGGTGEELIVVAVVVVAVAALALVGLAATEGARYDGDVALSPAQPVHLEGPAGTRVVPLGDLTAADLEAVREAVVKDDEGRGLRLLGRAPLDRRGLAFKLDLGPMQALFDEYSYAGLASNLQLGVFPHQKVGLLATVALSGGEDDGGSLLARHGAGLELQLFPLAYRRLHLGAYAQGGFTSVARGDRVEDGPSLGAGLLVELALTTRLALTGRAGWSAAHLPGGVWDGAGSVALGLAIY